MHPGDPAPPEGLRIGGGRYQEDRDAIRLQYLLGNLAKGTRGAHASAWRRRELFLKIKRGPYLQGRDFRLEGP